MHPVIVEVAGLVEELAEVKRKLADATNKAEYNMKDAIQAIKTEMQKALIESDIKREVAIARLDVYEKMNSKDDFNREIREMLKLAISGLSSNKPMPQQQKGGGQHDGQKKEN